MHTHPHKSKHITHNILFPVQCRLIPDLLHTRHCHCYTTSATTTTTTPTTTHNKPEHEHLQHLQYVHIHNSCYYYHCYYYHYYHYTTLLPLLPRQAGARAPSYSLQQLQHVHIESRRVPNFQIAIVQVHTYIIYERDMWIWYVNVMSEYHIWGICISYDICIYYVFIYIS